MKDYAKHKKRSGRECAISKAQKLRKKPVLSVHMLIECLKMFETVRKSLENVTNAWHHVLKRDCRSKISTRHGENKIITAEVIVKSA